VPKLLLVSGADTIDLNEIDDKGVGFQAKSGTNWPGPAPCLGPVARRRRRRRHFRGDSRPDQDIDLPLEILANDRADLQAQLSRLASCWPGGAPWSSTTATAPWSTEVHRVGGGDYTYGGDTIGEREFQTSITLPGRRPVLHVSEQQVRYDLRRGRHGRVPVEPDDVKVAPSQAIGEIDLSNSGDAPAYPVWEVTRSRRPLRGHLLPGETLKWNGTLTAGAEAHRRHPQGHGRGPDRRQPLRPARHCPPVLDRPAGQSTATASLLNTTSASQITCSWYPRKWMVV
jgi:hypothetical protein